MILYILRHAIAAEKTDPNYRRDADRPLTEKGEQKMKDVAKAMGKMGLKFDVIISSPFLRAKETAGIVAEVFECRSLLKLSPHLAVGGNPADLIKEINEDYPDAEEVLLVGHEPFLSSLISTLLSGRTDLTITLKKAGLCKLSIEKLRFGKCAVLEWLVGPGQLLA